MASPQTPTTKLLKKGGLYESHYLTFKAHGITSDNVSYITREEWIEDLNVPRVSDRIAIKIAAEGILAQVQDKPLPPVPQLWIFDESLQNKDQIAKQWIDLALSAGAGFYE
jgi:hypothetical protein